MLARALSWIRRRLGVNICRVLARPLASGTVAVVRYPNLVYRVADEAELLEAAADGALDLNPLQVRAAFRRGDSCVACFDGGGIIGYVWYAFGTAPHGEGIWVNFDAGARYAYKAFIHPAYRGKRLGLELYGRAGEICPRQGCELGVSLIYLDNTPSLRAATKVGWRTVGYAGYLRGWGIFRSFSTPGARRRGVRFYLRGAASQAFRPVGSPG